MAFIVQLEGRVRDELNERQSVAEAAGTAAELRLGDLLFVMQPSGSRYAMPFSNLDLRGSLTEGPRASGGWNLEVIFDAKFLATHRLPDALAYASRLAALFGTVTLSRLRRVDLAADFAGYPIQDGELKNYVVRKAKRAAFVLIEPKDVDKPLDENDAHYRREFYSPSGKPTGFSFAWGNDFSARIYDKTVELGLSGREGKRAIEEAIWKLNGWDGQSRVTRVEFQIRGTAVEEFSLRDPRDLEKSLDELWQYCVQKWLRLVIPGTDSRQSRCDLDARWQAAQSVVFSHVAQPIERKRVRGGASVEHVTGAMRSYLAANRALPRVELVTGDGEVVRNEVTWVDSLSPREQEDHVRLAVRKLASAYACGAPDEYLGKYGSRDALLKLVTANNATVARFSTLDDSTKPAQVLAAELGDFLVGSTEAAQ